MAAWRESCPLEGTCTECGLAFEWRELLSPQRAPPRWCVEAAAPPVVSPRQVAGTLVRSCWPRTVWRSVRMIHRCRWGRLAAYLGVLVVVAYVTTAAGIGVAAARDYRSACRFGTLNHSPWTVGIHAAVLPLSRASVGTYVGRRGRVFGSSPPAYFTLYLWYDRLAGSVMIAAAHLGTAVAFSVLPISRRRAKVRWRHIVRVTAYGLAVPLGVYVVNGLAAVVPDVRLAGMVGLVAAIALLPWAVLWWKTAASQYLRMEHPWAVSLSVVALGLAASTTAMGLLYYFFNVPPPI